MVPVDAPPHLLRIVEEVTKEAGQPLLLLLLIPLVTRTLQRTLSISATLLSCTALSAQRTALHLLDCCSQGLALAWAIRKSVVPNIGK